MSNELYFRHNGVTYKCEHMPAGYPSDAHLVIKTTDGQYYLGGYTSQGSKREVSRRQTGGYTYDVFYIDNSNPTIHFNRNGIVYHLAKRYWSEVLDLRPLYDIPAGTYTTQQFENQVANYFGSAWASSGTQVKKVVSNEFTYNINGLGAVTVPAGRTIGSLVIGSSPGNHRQISFQASLPTWIVISKENIMTYVGGKTYYTNWTSSYITISPGIKFQ